MHIHLPKAVHGWRAFAGEVGIIVLGVLIALGAEQVVQSVHLRHETDEASHAVRAELALSAGVFEERVAVQSCVDQRLRQLGVLVSTARQRHRLPDVGEIGRPPMRPLQSSAWTTASSRGLVAKFPQGDQVAIPVHYSQAANYAADVENEQEMWATLRLLEHHQGPLDGALLADVVTTLERLRFRSYLNGVDASQLLDSIKSMKIMTNYYMVDDEDGEKYDHAMLLQNVRARPICKPLLVDGEPLAVSV